MAERTLRGARLGGQSFEDERGIEFAARQQSGYRCKNDHEFEITMSVEAEIPALWECPRCGAEARATSGIEPEVKAEKPAKDKPAKEKSGKKKAAKALLDQPRGGQADDLKVIKGVGPKIEVWLNENGIWHFDQIAGWDAKDVASYMDRMGRMGTRIESDEWVAQARALAATGKVY